MARAVVANALDEYAATPPAISSAVLWGSAGIAMPWTDRVVNHEDQLFHLALPVVMPLLAGVGYVVVAPAVRPRLRVV